MRKTLSIRWKLILSTFAGVLGIVSGLIVTFQVRTYEHMLAELEKTLETKCDEVLTVLEKDGSPLTLETLLAVETNYRFSPYVYFYQISDVRGRLRMKSSNLGDATLPFPAGLRAGVSRVLIENTAYPGGGSEGELVRMRSERVRAVSNWGAEDLLVQIAVSLRPFQAAMHGYLLHAMESAVFVLGAVLFLLWFITTRSLRPVSLLTRRASRISATNLSERLPRSGTGDELDQLAAVVNDMLDRLQRSLHQMEQFTSDAAHQLRTPLTRVRGELDLILRDGVTEPIRGELERVQEELERLSRACGRLLLLARLDQEAQEGTLFTDHLNLEEMVDDLMEQMRPLAHEKAVELRRGPVSRVEVRGSKPLIVEALLNLLDNAMRVTDEGGTIEVSLTASAGNATLAVKDSGPGIPPDEQAKIFRRFYKIPRERLDADEGTGLGLSIVKAIAEAHDGAVDVVSAPGQGSCFRLSLPSNGTG